MIEAALFERLSNDAALVARVGKRIYPMKLPQDAVLPALTYFRAATHTEHTHNGAAGIAAPLFQVSIWTKGSGGALAAAEIAELVRLALDGFKGTVGNVVIDGIFLRNQNDTYEDEIEVFHRPMDFEIWHEEPRPSF